MSHFRIYRQALRVGARDFSVYWSWKTWLGGWMVRLLTTALLWVLLGRLLASPEKLTYLLVGHAATAGVGTFTVAVAVWDRFDGTYPLLVVSPPGAVTSILGRMSIWVFGWVASSLLTFVVLGAIFGWRAPLHAAPWIVVLVVALCASTFFLTGALGALANMAIKLRNIINTTLLIVISAFCGVSVPVAFWPDWIQVGARMLPVTHALAGIRAALDGAEAWVMVRAALLEVLVGLGWATLTFVTFKRVTERGRADGSIDFVRAG